MGTSRVGNTSCLSREELLDSLHEISTLEASQGLERRVLLGHQSYVTIPKGMQPGKKGREKTTRSSFRDIFLLIIQPVAARRYPRPILIGCLTATAVCMSYQYS